MNAKASALIGDDLREIRQLIEDSQHQHGDHFKQTVGRILTDIVNILEALATFGGDEPLPSAESRQPPDPKGGAF